VVDDDTTLFLMEKSERNVLMTYSNDKRIFITVIL